MSKIVVKIVSDKGSESAGGMADAKMLKPLAADVLLTTEIPASNVSGGVLPITQAEYIKVLMEQEGDFYSPLITALGPKLGAGSATFTRASVAYIVDWEGLLKSCVSGEARFYGARRVQNLLRASAGGSSDLTQWSKVNAGAGSAPTVTAGQTAPDGSATAFRLVCATGGSTAADQSYIAATSGTPAAGGARGQAGAALV